MSLRHSPSTACKRVVSGTISLPSQGYFSPFPHGTGSLSVASEYLALPDGPGRFPQGSTCPAVLRNRLKVQRHFHLQGCHLLWPAFPDRSINLFDSLVNQVSVGITHRTPDFAALQHHALLSNHMVWAGPISLAATFGITVVLFSSGY
jgi:hypothetical protein